MNIIIPSAHVVGLYFFLGCPKMSSLIFEMLMNTILKFFGVYGFLDNAF